MKAHRGGKVTINVVENDTDAQRDIDPNTVQLLDKDGKGVTRLVVDKQGVWTVGRGGNVTTDVLARICEALDCDVADICEVVPTDMKGVTD